MRAPSALPSTFFFNGRPAGTERRFRRHQPADGAASSRVHSRNVYRRAWVTFPSASTAMGAQLLATVPGLPVRTPATVRAHDRVVNTRERDSARADWHGVPMLQRESSCFRSVGQPATTRHAGDTVGADVPGEQWHWLNACGRWRGFAPAQPAERTFALMDVATNTSMPRAPAREAG